MKRLLLIFSLLLLRRSADDWSRRWPRRATVTIRSACIFWWSMILAITSRSYRIGCAEMLPRSIKSALPSSSFRAAATAEMASRNKRNQGPTADAAAAGLAVTPEFAPAGTAGGDRSSSGQYRPAELQRCPGRAELLRDQRHEFLCDQRDGFFLDQRDGRAGCADTAWCSRLSGASGTG